MTVHDVSDGLCVGGRARSAAPDCVVHLGQFVGDAVCDVGAGSCAGVGAEDDTFGECDGHAGGRTEIRGARKEGGREGDMWSYIEVPRLERREI